jgi:hypothetical protein
MELIMLLCTYHFDSGSLGCALEIVGGGWFEVVINDLDLMTLIFC